MTQREGTDHPLPPLPQTPSEPAFNIDWNGQSAEWGNGQEENGADTASLNSLQKTPPQLPQPSVSVKRKAVPGFTSLENQPEVQLQHAPLSPVNISPPRVGLREPDVASIRQMQQDAYDTNSRRSSGLPESPSITLTDATNLQHNKKPSNGKARMSDERPYSRVSSGSHPRIDEDEEDLDGDVPEIERLQYHGFDDAPRKKMSPQQKSMHERGQSLGSGSSGSGSGQQLGVPRNGGIVRPMSMMSLGPELRGRTLSPLSANGSDQSPRNSMRDLSSNRKSPHRPVSYVENLNNLPYAQQIAPGAAFNDGLSLMIGNAASRMDTKKTLEMYRANVKKTNEPAIQYEFAIFMINASRQVTPADGMSPVQLQLEAKQILQKLADRAYPFAQYYLGDGYFSGMFSKDKPDKDKAFGLFVAASKHGHAEAGYRAALCYEFGWGTAKAYPKAVQFYRNAASKNHPGAATRLGLACIRGDMGLTGREKQREGTKWLKRASESADVQYNAGPYELGLLHLTGFGDDIFKDEAYASQLLTHSAELGHAQASFLMGQAYENGQLGCPRDAALSVHFYTGAADKGHPEAMMALCAWYMVGAEPVLEKDEGEAYAWAKAAAETGFSKAEYAVGYFTEMGIGCRRDPLEANVWYVRAADQGNETAYQRLQIIRAAAGGGDGVPMKKAGARSKELGGGGENGFGGAGGGGGGGGGVTPGREKKKFMGIF